MNLSNRKPTRLKDYDYSSPGAYFVTICTQNRKNIFEIESVGNGLCAVPLNVKTAHPNGYVGKKNNNCTIQNHIIFNFGK